MIQAAIQPSFSDWRRAARRLLAAGVEPGNVLWVDLSSAQMGLLEEPAPAGDSTPFRVPSAFASLAQTAALHRDPERWALLYRTVYRLLNGSPRLMENEADDDVRRLRMMEAAVHHDAHRMTAFLRFRRSGDDYIAWYKPDHRILRRTAPFFVERFGSMRWAILTPDESAYWDTETLRFGPGVHRSTAPQADEIEPLWRSYYKSIFNPARANAKLVVQHVPVRYWETMPEAQLIPELLLSAEGKVQTMKTAQNGSAARFIPPNPTIASLRTAARKCTACHLCEHATQTVFGEGPERARVLLIGEQPGDEEDLQGKPFVGPAGRVLNDALVKAGIGRSDAYVTNVVKHFKFVERGKRRIHQTPRGPEIAACKPWLEAELDVVQPEVIVCLGATAARAMMGGNFRVLTERGRFFEYGPKTQLMATVHPSMLLRIPDPAAREEQKAMFLKDLTKVAAKAGDAPPAAAQSSKIGAKASSGRGRKSAE